MYTDEHRCRVQDELRRQDHQLFVHLLTPELFVQAARMCGLKIISSPLNLVNLVWLALVAARHPEQSFASLLDRTRKALHDQECFPSSSLGPLLDDADRQRRQARRPDPRPSRHAPQGTQGADQVTDEAFAKARQRMPSAFWVALFVLLGERFEAQYAEVLRWGSFRLMAVDGTRLDLPDYPAWRAHFGTARNASGSHNAQARMVLVQFPLARLPYADALEPVHVGETTMARQLLQGLRPRDLVLRDAGFRSYGVLAPIAQQPAFFCLRLGQKLNLKVLQELGSANDVLVQWQPKDSRGQWRKEGLPRCLRLRRLRYPLKGYRPLVLLTNVLSAAEVPYERWWGLSWSAEGEVLRRGIYHWRWEIETTYRELKVEQRLEGSLRSRLPEGIAYEVAGHVLLYLLMRWLLVEAAGAAGVSPLRLSFQAAWQEVDTMTPQTLLTSADWLEQTLRPRRRQRLAAHVVPARPGRAYPRSARVRRTQKRAKTAQFRRAQKAKARGKPTPKPRPWFGNGWTLQGRRSDPDHAVQG